MVGMDEMDPRDQLDSRDQLDPMDAMDSRAQWDLLVQKGKREIEEYSYEGLLDYKVQEVLATSQGELVYRSYSFSHIYIAPGHCAQ